MAFRITELLLVNAMGDIASEKGWKNMRAGIRLPAVTNLSFLVKYDFKAFFSQKNSHSWSIY